MAAAAAELTDNWTLTLSDTHGKNSAVAIDAATPTVGHLKALLRRDGIVPVNALRCHVAHRGRVLADDEPLEPLRTVPTAVLAVVMPPPPRSAAGPPPPSQLNVQPVQQPPQAHLPRMMALPSRAEVAAAWERAFPSLRESEALTAQHTRAAEEEEEEEPTCRVCFCGEEAGRLLAPCRCRGSVKYIHESCLNEWRVRSANPRSFERCDQCGYRYRTTPSRLGRWLKDERVHQAGTLLLLCLLYVLGTLLPFRPERLLYRKLHWHPRYSYTWWGGRCDATIRGLMLPALAGFAQSIHHAYKRHRGLPFEQQTWLAGLVLALAADGDVALRPLLVGGFFYFSAVLSVEMRVRSRILCTRFGERVENFEDEATAIAPRPQSTAR